MANLNDGKPIAWIASEHEIAMLAEQLVFTKKKNKRWTVLSGSSVLQGNLFVWVYSKPETKEESCLHDSHMTDDGGKCMGATK